MKSKVEGKVAVRRLARRIVAGLEAQSRAREYSPIGIQISRKFSGGIFVKIDGELEIISLAEYILNKKPHLERNLI